MDSVSPIGRIEFDHIDRKDIPMKAFESIVGLGSAALGAHSALENYKNNRQLNAGLVKDASVAVLAGGAGISAARAIATRLSADYLINAQERYWKFELSKSPSQEDPVKAFFKFVKASRIESVQDPVYQKAIGNTVLPKSEIDKIVLELSTEPELFVTLSFGIEVQSALRTKQPCRSFVMYAGDFSSKYPLNTSQPFFEHVHLCGFNSKSFGYNDLNLAREKYLELFFPPRFDRLGTVQQQIIANFHHLLVFGISEDVY